MEPKEDNFSFSETTIFGEPLTLRDRFAIKAMDQMNWVPETLDDAATAAYQVADAMLSARNAK